MNKTFKLISAILICHMAGILGAFFTTPQIDGWYSTLVKPSFNPPSWIFGPVWLTLYTLMGISLFLIWQNKGNKKAVNWFYLQLLLNASWSIIFFGAHELFLAFIIILAMVLSVIKTMLEFWKINKMSVYLLVPYLLWISFAGFLNYNIWILN
jgi:tryptophan-rich sensory protein